MDSSAVAAGLLIFLTILASLFKEKSELLKYLLFIGIFLVVTANTVYLIGSTIYLNQKSLTGGPVHYHADFEIWNCGQQVELKDPTGFSNKVGSEVVHEHNDNKIHIEGVLLDERDASLAHFFEEIGGSLKNNSLTFTTNEGLAILANGQNCPNGKSVLQVFVYQTKGNKFYQQKLENPADYIISPYNQVPPGDCIIIELDQPKEKTDKLCTLYQVAVEKGKIYGD